MRDSIAAPAAAADKNRRRVTMVDLLLMWSRPHLKESESALPPRDASGHCLQPNEAALAIRR
jgi:hypothetical protein